MHPSQNHPRKIPHLRYLISWVSTQSASQCKMAAVPSAPKQDGFYPHLASIRHIWMNCLSDSYAGVTFTASRKLSGNALPNPKNSIAACNMSLHVMPGNRPKDSIWLIKRAGGITFLSGMCQRTSNSPPETLRSDARTIGWIYALNYPAFIARRSQSFVTTLRFILNALNFAQTPPQSDYQQ